MKKHLIQLSLVASLALPTAAIAQNVFPASGNVGIGTSSPRYTLDIGSGYDASATRVVSINGGWSDPGAPGTSVPGDKILFWNSNDGSYKTAQGFYPQNAMWFQATVPQGRSAFRFFTGDGAGAAPVERVSIGGNGFVGINNSNPQAALDIDGNIMLTSGGAQRRIDASGRLLIQSGETLYLNPFSGLVSVGGGGGPGNLFVVGKTTTSTLELTSDRNQKQDFQPASKADILAKVAALPVTTWAYTNSPTVRHLGPMAQDFKAAFDLGEDDKHIGAGDGIGVALAAIQGLNEKLEAEVQAKDAEIAALKKQLAGVTSELADVKQTVSDRLAALEKALAKDVQQANYVRPHPQEGENPRPGPRRQSDGGVNRTHQS